MHKYVKILIVIGVAVAFKNLLHFLLDKPEDKQQAADDSTSTQHSTKALRIFTVDELSSPDKLYLAILGTFIVDPLLQMLTCM